MSYDYTESRRQLPRDRTILQRLFLSGDDADAHFVSGAGGRVFHLHRLILSQQSRVFARMLTSSFKEGSSSAGSPPSPIVLGEVSPQALEALFAFMYGAELPASAEVVFLCEVWEAAHRFEVEDLERAAQARTHALLPLQPRAAFAVLTVARAVRDDGMMQTVYREMAARLPAVAASPLLAELAVEDVMAVLAMPEQCRDVEGILLTRFNLIMRWVENDAVERGSLADRLMAYVDLRHATAEEVEAMANRPIANQSSTLMRKIAKRFADLAKENQRLERRIASLRHDVRALRESGQRVEGSFTDDGAAKSVGAGTNFNVACMPHQGRNRALSGPGVMPFSGASSFTDDVLCARNPSSQGVGTARVADNWHQRDFGGWGSHPPRQSVFRPYFGQSQQETEAGNFSSGFGRGYMPMSQGWASLCDQPGGGVRLNSSATFGRAHASSMGW